MGQLSLFARAQTAGMRDRTRSRNYSAERDEFRRVHKEHRDWGLRQRHGRKLLRLRQQGTTSLTTPAAHSDLQHPAAPAAPAAAQPATAPTAEPAPAPTVVPAPLPPAPPASMLLTPAPRASAPFMLAPPGSGLFTLALPASMPLRLAPPRSGRSTVAPPASMPLTLAPPASAPLTSAPPALAPPPSAPLMPVPGASGLPGFASPVPASALRPRVFPGLRQGDSLSALPGRALLLLNEGGFCPPLVTVTLCLIRKHRVGGGHHAVAGHLNTESMLRLRAGGMRLAGAERAPGGRRPPRLPKTRARPRSRSRPRSPPWPRARARPWPRARARPWPRARARPWPRARARPPPPPPTSGPGPDSALFRPPLFWSPQRPWGAAVTATNGGFGRAGPFADIKPDGLRRGPPARNRPPRAPTRHPTKPNPHAAGRTTPSTKPAGPPLGDQAGAEQRGRNQPAAR
jgi:hypothetical protein